MSQHACMPAALRGGGHAQRPAHLVQGGHHGVAVGHVVARPVCMSEHGQLTSRGCMHACMQAQSIKEHGPMLRPPP